MKKKITLKQIGSFFLQTIPETTWVTMDMTGIKVFDGSGVIPPQYNRAKYEWEYCGGLIAKIDISIVYIITRPYTSHGDIIFPKCIEVVSPAVVASLAVEKRKYTKHKKGVLAYFADGSTLLFESKKEAKEFFGLNRIETVTQYINTGNPLPDGTTTLDEALDDTPKKETKPKGKRK